jgi:hypothetical protein
MYQATGARAGCGAATPTSRTGAIAVGDDAAYASYCQRSKPGVASLRRSLFTDPATEAKALDALRSEHLSSRAASRVTAGDLAVGSEVERVLGRGRRARRWPNAPRRFGK